MAGRFLPLSAFVFVITCVQAAPRLWQQEGTVVREFQTVRPQDVLARGANADGHWRLVDYESIRYNGTMLFSVSGTKPKPVTVDPGLKGWYRIYAATFSGLGGRLWLQLKGDPSPSVILQGNTGAGFWMPYEQGEEVFWTCADLTGKDITVGKPCATGDIGLMWLRFEPMSEAEIVAAKSEFADADNRRLHAHSDMEWMRSLYGSTPTTDELCGLIESYARSDVEVATLEVPPGEFSRKKAGFFRECVRRAEKYGIGLYVAHRMSKAHITFPWGEKDGFLTAHPQWQCRDRDGGTVSSVSYAFPEVGDYMIAQYIEHLDYGFHGVSPILHRGIQLLFEEPVVSRFREKYPDLDPRTLSLDDPRLADVRCEIFNENFMRRLRLRLDEYSAAHKLPRLRINPIVPCSIADCRRQGLDVEGWVRDGIVDSVVFGCMRVWEDEEKFRDEAKPGLLSVEKYAVCKRTGVRSPVRRSYSNSLQEELIASAAANAKLARETGVKFYYDVHWEGSLPPESIADYALKLYDAGAENLSLWDCFEIRVSNRPEWFVTSRLGHKKELKALPKDNRSYRRVFRILKLDGGDLSGYNPNWFG